MSDTIRDTDLSTILTMLQEQHARKVDVVAPATTIRSVNGSLVVAGAEAQITDEGVTTTDGWYAPTGVALEGIADKLRIPITYVRRMFADRPDLFDANVNGWLRGQTMLRPAADPDPRSFLLRCFKSDDDNGVMRAFLSDSYKVIDHLDVLMATLDGIRATGVKAEVVGGDLTERRMRVRIMCPEIFAYAPTLLKGYRSPYTGLTGEDNPVLFAGLEIANSEVGSGAHTITPRMVIEVCKNGMTVTKDAVRNVHLGGRLDAGTIKWSDETQRHNLDLVKSQTVDAVRTFLDVDYMTTVIERAEGKATTEVRSVDDVRNVTRPLGFTEDEINDVLTCFISGGQTTLGGVFNAITAAVQVNPDGDRAAEMEAAAASILL